MKQNWGIVVLVTLFIIGFLLSITPINFSNLFRFGNNNPDPLNPPVSREYSEASCLAEGGEIINTLGDYRSCPTEDILGEVKGLKCPCVCCKADSKSVPPMDEPGGRGGGVDPDIGINPIGDVACTLEAKICPDGSSVGRVPPDCEFAPCPRADGQE